jgi:hypothetical protein
MRKIPTPDTKGKRPRTDASTLLDFALGYYARGWTVLPVSITKNPAIRTWKKYQQERPQEQDVRDWFTSPGVEGIAIILGTASDGLHCRDFDAAAAYYRWAADHPDLARSLPTSQTGRGNNVFFRGGPDTLIKLDDGEYRGSSAGYVIVPPSRHQSGATYRWIVPPGNEIPIIDPVASGLLPPRPENVQTSPAGSERSDSSDSVAVPDTPGSK